MAQRRGSALLLAVPVIALSLPGGLSQATCHDRGFRACSDRLADALRRRPLDDAVAVDDAVTGGAVDRPDLAAGAE